MRKKTAGKCQPFISSTKKPNEMDEIPFKLGLTHTLRKVIPITANGKQMIKLINRLNVTSSYLQNWYFLDWRKLKYKVPNSPFKTDSKLKIDFRPNRYLDSIDMVFYTDFFQSKINKDLSGKLKRVTHIWLKHLTAGTAFYVIKQWMIFCQLQWEKCEKINTIEIGWNERKIFSLFWMKFHFIKCTVYYFPDFYTFQFDVKMHSTSSGGLIERAPSFLLDSKMFFSLYIKQTFSGSFKTDM